MLLAKCHCFGPEFSWLSKLTPINSWLLRPNPYIFCEYSLCGYSATSIAPMCGCCCFSSFSVLLLSELLCVATEASLAPLCVYWYFSSSSVQKMLLLNLFWAAADSSLAFCAATAAPVALLCGYWCFSSFSVKLLRLLLFIYALLLLL